MAWADGSVRLFSGGEKATAFAALFDQEKLAASFVALGHDKVTVYGEAYGGKCQGMKATYGERLSFVAFDVRIGDAWLSVPNAQDVSEKIGLEFIPWHDVEATVEALDRERDSPSEISVRRGITEPRIREGIVIRPYVELTDSRGERLIAKHKRVEFSERATIPEVDPTKREMMENAEAIALEWVSDMRLSHVLDKLGNPTEMDATGKVIAAMVEDVCREASGEIVESKAARKAIGARAAKLYKARITTVRPA